ncbi:MAG: type II and III secretion system protein [Lentisphaerae bacterium]|nr:type II and III secretion system protein [Lentisphaerota bacterium]
MNAKATALSFLCLALAGCASFEDELPESCVVIEEVKATPPNKVVIDTKMEVRSYPILAAFVERMSSASEDMKGFGASTIKSEVVAKESDEDRELKEFFARSCGVTWPVGSSCTYVRSIGKLRVRNTPENLKLIDSFVDEVNARDVLLEVQARFVRVAQKTLDEIGAELFPGKGAGYRYDLVEFDAVPAGELERRLASRRDLVENKVCRVTTRSGEEAIFKNVSECIYPTDYEVQMSSYAPSGSNDWVRTGEYGFASVEPQSFTMREVGSILDVTPVMTDDEQVINLSLNMQIVAPPEWKDYGMQLPSACGGTYALPMQQPFFPVFSPDAKLSVTPGETVLVGSGVSQGKADETEFIFVRTRKLAYDGRPAKSK